MRIAGLLIGLVLIIGLTGVASAEPENQLFVVEFDITPDYDVSDETARITEGANVRVPGSGQGDYDLVLRDVDGRTVYETETHIIFHIAFHGDHSDTEIDQLRFYARVPYHADAVTAELLKDGEVLASLDLVQHICDQPTTDIEQEYCNGDSLPLLLILGAFIVIALVVGGGYLYRKRQDSPAPQRLQSQQTPPPRDRRRRRTR